MDNEIQSTQEATRGRQLVSIVIPAFNEGRIFTRNIKILDEYIGRHEALYRFELIIVNDGSSDETGALADKFSENREEVRVVHHRKNLGLGAALRTGFAHARGEVIIPLDLDLSYSVDHLGQLLKSYNDSGAELVLLSPYMSTGKVSLVPAHRLLFSRCANYILSSAQGGALHTSTGMVRAYSRKLLDRMALKSSGMEINLETLLKSVRAGARIKEIPAHLNWEHRTEPVDRHFRLSFRRLFRQVALVLRYAWLFLKARPAVHRTVLP